MDGTFPYCRVRRAKKDELLAAWRDLGPPDIVMNKAVSLHCVETNELEGTVTFAQPVSPRTH